MRINQDRKFAFTEKSVKEICEGESDISYTDTICKGLKLISGSRGNGGYHFQYFNPETGSMSMKVIGNIFRVPLEQARAIVRNIQSNFNEFINNPLDRCDTLAADFTKNGYYPRKKAESLQGTETILSDENASLKRKIKELEQEKEELQNTIVRLRGRMDTIKKLVCYDENDLEIDD